MPQGNIATIDAAKPRLTLITVQKVEAGKRAGLARLLSEIADGNIRQAPGFVSVGGHGSVDRTKLVNHANGPRRHASTPSCSSRRAGSG